MESVGSELIVRLRELFKKMEASRIRLRPILADIAASIDKGFFLDADSEEVNLLLKQILEAQEKFSNIEQTKRAATSGKLELVDKVLSDLEQNSMREEIVQVLSRISTIVLDSQEPKMVESVRKVKLQAERIKNNSIKTDMVHLSKLAERFVLLDEIISDDNTISTEKYLEVVPHFTDNPILLMALSQNKLHFPRPVEPEPAVEIELLPEPVEVKPEKKPTFNPTAHAVSAVNVKFRSIKPPPDLSLVVYDEKSFEIEKSAVKKNFSVKSFNNKLHEMLDSSDPSPIFRIFMEARVFFKSNSESLKASGKFSKKLSVFIPTILEKLFAWGIADKVTWRERQFYYLNNAGYELCSRVFRNIRTSQNSNENDFETLIRAIKYSSMKIAESKIKDGLRINFEYHTNIPFARAERKFDGDSTQVLLMFSLNLLGENWNEGIAKFRMLIEHEISQNNEVKAVFVFTFKVEDLPWMKMFDTVKFKTIRFFMCTPEKIYAPNGVDLEFDEWLKISRFGRPSLRRVRKSPNLKDSEDEKNKKLDVNIPLPLEQEEPKIDSDAQIVETEEVAEPAFNEISNEEVSKKFFDDFLDDDDDDDSVEEDDFDDEEDLDEDEEPPIEKIDEEVTTIDIKSTLDSEEKNFKLPVAEKKSAPVVEEKVTAPAEVEVTTIENDLAKVDSVTGVTNLFRIGAKSRAMLALHALKDFIAQTEPDNDNWAAYLADEIGFILDDPLSAQVTRHIDPFTFWTGAVEIPKANVGKTFDYLNLAAMIKCFFAPLDPTSYQIQKSWRQLNEDKSNTALRNYPAAKNLISLFNGFTEKTHRAFADCLVGAGNSNEDNFQLALAQVEKAENISDSILHSDVNHRRVKDLINQLFSINGLVRKYLDVKEYSADEILSFCRTFEDTDLSVILSESGAHIDEELFSEKIISDYLDRIWNNPKVQLVRKEREPFKGPKRKRVTEIMKQCLTALLSYVYAKRNLDESTTTGKPSAPVDKAIENLDDLKKQMSKDKKLNLGQIIFKLFIENLEKKLNGENVALIYNECILTANYIELENGLPTINSFGVEEFSLKNRVMNFEADMKGKTFDESLKSAYETSLKNYDCGILQHLTKFYLPQLNVPEEEIKRKISGLDRQVDKQIDRVYAEFLSDLELARNYSRITDQEKIEFYIDAVVEARKHFMQTKNAGLFQNFINACNQSINKTSIPHKNALTKRLKKLEETLEQHLSSGETLETRYPIITNIRRQIELMNLTVAEDYMNRLETEGGNLLTELDVTGYDLSTLETFLNDYETLYRSISSANGSVEGAFKQRVHTNRPNRETQDALDFLRGWQGIHSGQTTAIENAVIDILKHLGYDGGRITARNFDALNQKSYTISFDEPIKARESYPHPFAVFGTEIYSKGLEVIYLGANRRYDNIAQVLGEMTVDRGTICLADVAMTLPERRSLAKIMKLTTNLKNVLVLDKVMALYLASFDDATRGKRMLQTVLPFSRVQPYTTGGVVAPEMFIGRSEELDQIRDMKGPVFVYGGRQLGKSALLRQVRNIEHNPRQLNYAFFIDLKNLDSEQTLKKITYELSNAKLIGEVQNWEEFSYKMHKLLNGQFGGIDKPRKLLLLMDESDTFLSQKDSEKAINVLRELLVTFNGQFKFVLAGLHKVIRFEQNSSFGNLNHISVLPFKPSDAMELLVKPMSWLGFRISDESLISAIFSRTNYYPGSIQYYCKMLVDAVGANYTKQNFDVVKNPPYTLDDEYLKNVLGNREFQEEIRQKFQITLCLDDDNYYEILALAVAMAYYENGRPIGVSLTDIKDYCLMCGVEKIGKLSDNELLSLLDEMVTLNILRRADGKFEFNRYAFWHMMGTVEEANKKLDSYGTLGARA
ncbi:MAG: hypothetical protein IKZ58_04515 [Selenomonadaceae bacterium]|nr:hypothetical protein [Selenomonadaceae bacterium]